MCTYCFDIHCNPQIIMLPFSQNELSHFSTEVNRYICTMHRVYATQGFTPIPLKFYRFIGHGLRSAYCLDIYIPQINF